MLQWIGTGAIMCAEGGGHHRPNRHAELARDIFRNLELVIANRSADPLEQLLARRMHPKCGHALLLIMQRPAEHPLPPQCQL